MRDSSIICWECGLDLAAPDAAATATTSDVASVLKDLPAPPRPWFDHPAVGVALGVVCLIVVVVLLLQRSGGDGFPARVAGRGRLPLPDAAEVQRELAGVTRFGAADAKMAAYGDDKHGIQLVVLTATVLRTFDFDALLRTTAALQGIRVSLTPVDGPAGWSCAKVDGAEAVFAGVGRGAAELCHRTDGDAFVAFAFLGDEGASAIAAELD